MCAKNGKLETERNMLEGVRRATATEEAKGSNEALIRGSTTEYRRTYVDTYYVV